ncbi:MULTISPECIES: hypothetical protein [unclassified Streptomyces]|uniref:hypothetical protein n=1 Tax=unclassified Streptomyces TaxID=2593676 RepID=UPI001BE576E6|nr:MULTISPECIES: hypothetical protein [unclassified Streptomyces]MBT2408448.1 hypothetical protein [Streptomyces sp. ISL-21]MBT2611908.1 hypothetical protein [Streptomyces sp. ISL-87]
MTEPIYTDPIYYVDRSDIHDGKLAEVKSGMRDLAAFAEEREPQLIAYHFYIDESESTMTVLAVHPDSASMELHMELGGPKFRAFGALIRMRSIDVYGRPSPEVVTQLRQKAEMLGGGTVNFHTPQAGFSRLHPPRNTAQGSRAG